MKVILLNAKTTEIEAIEYQKVKDKVVEKLENEQQN